MHTETAAKSIELPRWAATDWRLTVTHYRLLCTVAAKGNPWLPLSGAEAGRLAAAPIHTALLCLDDLAGWGMLLKSRDRKGGPTLYRVWGV